MTNKLIQLTVFLLLVLFVGCSEPPPSEPKENLPLLEQNQNSPLLVYKDIGKYQYKVRGEEAVSGRHEFRQKTTITIYAKMVIISINRGLESDTIILPIDSLDRLSFSR